MASRSDIKAGGAYVEVSARINKFLKGMNQVSARLSDIGKSMRNFGASVTAAGAAIATPLIAASKVFADVGSKIDDIAQRTGASASGLSELAYAATLSGSSMEDLEAGLKTMSKTLTKAASGKTPAVFKALGLEIKQLLSLSPDEQFSTIADALSKVTNPTLRAGYAMQIFGKAGASLLPMISSGASGIAALRSEAVKLGVSMSGPEVKAAAEYGDALDRVGQALKGLTVRIGSALAEPFTKIANVMANVLGTINQWIGKNKKLFVTIALIGAGLTLAGGALIAAAGVVGTIGLGLAGAAAAAATIGGALAAAASIIGAIGSAIVGAILTPIGAVVTAAAALGGYFAFTSGAVAQLGAVATGVFAGMRVVGSIAMANIKKGWDAFSNAIAAGDIQAAFELATAAINLAWVAAVETLKSEWASASTYVLNTWTDVSASIAEFGANAFYSLLGAWDTVVTRMQQLWNGTKASILIGIEGIRTAIEMIQAAIAAIASGESINAAMNAVKAKGQKRINDLAASQGKGSVDLEIGLQSRNAQRRDQASQLGDTIRQDASSIKGSRSAGASDAISRARQSMLAAQSAYEAARQKAAGVVADSSGTSRLGSLKDSLAMAGGGKSESVGSFNASVAGRLGASTLESDMLKSMESMVDLLKDISDNTADGLGGIELE